MTTQGAEKENKDTETQRKQTEGQIKSVPTLTPHQGTAPDVSKDHTQKKKQTQWVDRGNTRMEDTKGKYKKKKKPTEFDPGKT